MEEWIQYEKIQSRNESLITIVTHHETVKNMIEKLEDWIEKSKKIGNVIKRHEIKQSLESLYERMKINHEDENEILHRLYFLSTSHGIFYEMNLSVFQYELLQEYQFPTFIYSTSEFFAIDEWKDIFTNFFFIPVIQFQQHQIRIYKLNQYKMKEIGNHTIRNENQCMEIYERTQREENGKYTICYGQSGYLNGMKNRGIERVYLEHMMKKEIWMKYENEKMREHLQMLQRKLDELNDERNIDLYVFGRIKIEIKEHIENYLLKELYIEERKIKIVKELLSEEYFNFKIIPIRSLESGDIGERFIRDYHGLMGIKYY